MKKHKPAALPLCPEVCWDCKQGKHVMHVLTELANLVVTKKYVRTIHGRKKVLLEISGCAEDEDFLVELIQVANHAISKEMGKPED